MMGCVELLELDSTFIELELEKLKCEREELEEQQKEVINND